MAIKEILSFKKLNATVDQVVKAKDYTLHLSNGKTLTDTMSGLWCTPLGYSDQRIKSAMKVMLDKLPYGSNFSGNQNKITEHYAKKLCDITSMDRVYFTNSGSAAVETAIKLTRRNIAICSKHSYHGSTILSANVSDQGINKHWGIQNPMTVYKFTDHEDLYNILNGRYYPTFVIIEPVIGAGGVYEHKPEVFEVLKKWQDNGGIVIFDETITGFGKLGTMFAFEKYDFKPDILVLGKGITNGYFPMGACLVKEHILKDIKMFNHGFTFSGHPVGCSAGFATLSVLENRNPIIPDFDLRLENVKEHRQIGCMGAIDFETPKQSLTFIKKMREKGYILEDGSENPTTAVYCLPYIITRKDYELFIKTMQEVIDVS
jgi:adenosylmethionine-8-amino-7-oxononanoate aminotransferase